MKPVRARLTYANVIATLALFIALGATSAFAASQLAKNSVGAKQLKANAVTSAKIKNKAVTAAKLNLATLGTVPSASHAADASTADTATDASQLGGIPASGYQERGMWALVSSSGTLLQQSGGISLQAHPLSGSYFLAFPRQIFGKAMVVSTTMAGSGPANAYAQATVCGNAGASSVLCGYGADTTSEALVETYVAGSEEEASFYILVTP